MYIYERILREDGSIGIGNSIEVEDKEAKKLIKDGKAVEMPADHLGKSAIKKEKEVKKEVIEEAKEEIIEE